MPPFAINLSFNSEDFTLRFELRESGEFSGSFVSNEMDVPTHDFTGIYTEEDGNIELAFYIDWDIPDRPPATLHSRV